MKSKAQFLTSETRIYVSGHRGLVGSALMRCLKSKGFTNLVVRTHEELELTDQRAVRNFFQEEKIDYVIVAAAKVGGIYANNTYPAEFIYGNLMVEANLIHEAYQAGIERIMFMGSSCIYPKHAPQPMREDALLTGLMEPTNEPYAVAKIAGIKLCESYNRQYGTHYRSLMPTNLYGPNDNFDLENSHVLPALMRKFQQAKEKGEPSCEVWGSGSPRREFLHVDDLADACVFLMGLPDEIYESSVLPMLSHVNVGTGEDVTILNLAKMIGEIVGYQGKINFNAHKPDGPPRKLLDVSLLNRLGWKSKIPLKEGIASTYQWYLEHQENSVVKV
jgi:GDP-L-fucose synthase